MSESHTEVALALNCKIGGEPISPSNVDVVTYRNFLNDFADFVQGEEKRADLEDSQFTVEEGSLRFKAVVVSIVATSFNADLETLNATGDLDAISPKRAKVVETWMQKARKNPEISYSVSLPNDPEATIQITNDSLFTRKGKSMWTQAEKYIAGKVVDIGGKNSPNIHVVTIDGNFVIGASEDQLRGADYLYHHKAFNVLAKEHLTTGELDEIKLVEVIETSKEVDKSKLEALWERGREAWQDVQNPSEWVDEYRGHKRS